MREPLPYREPDTDDPAVIRRRRAASAVRVGSVTLAGSILLMLSPLLLGYREPVRFMMLGGFLGACFGLSSVVHGAWDWFSGTR